MNTPKIEEFYTKIAKINEPDKSQMFQKLDHDFSILKLILVSYDKMGRKVIIEILELYFIKNI